MSDETPKTEIYTMPEQFIPKTLKIDWKGMVLLLSLALVLGGFIFAGVFFLIKSFKQIEEEPGAKKETTALTQTQLVETSESPVAETLPSETSEATPSLESKKEEEQPLTEKEEISEILGADIYPLSQDSDKDGLTDLEEGILSTDSLSADTDGDGYSDADELIGLYNPKQGEGAKLSDSGIILVFNNPLFGWSVFYPPAWLARPLDETNREVIITASTGEFIQISQQPNPEKLSLIDWYLTQAPGIDPKTLSEETTKSELNCLWAPDRLTVYLTKTGDEAIYLISYNIGTRTELNFSSIFRMMVQSLEIP